MVVLVELGVFVNARQLAGVPVVQPLAGDEDHTVVEVAITKVDSDVVTALVDEEQGHRVEDDLESLIQAGIARQAAELQERLRSHDLLKDSEVLHIFHHRLVLVLHGFSFVWVGRVRLHQH